MINYIKRITTLAFAAVIISSSCSDSKTNTEEQTQLNTMDSTSKAVKESTDKLQDQTSKVEASLEKLDSEFKSNN
jgi:septal ring factor EnvC (AmiA/AmiB activator)